MTVFQTPSVSVVIPTWNRVATLGAAIGSALSQSNVDLEVLVCDDGSTDGSREMVTGIANPRVRWVWGPRGGRPAIPRNRGIREARGEWIAFLDSDDQWLPGKIEEQLSAAARLGVGAVCTNAWHVGPSINGRALGGPGVDARLGWLGRLRRNDIHCSSVLVRRSLLVRTGGFPEEQGLTVGEDYAAWLRVIAFTDFAYLGRPSITYFDDPRTTVRAQSVDGWTQQTRVLDSFLRWSEDQPDGVPPPMIVAARAMRGYAAFRRTIRPLLRRGR